MFVACLLGYVWLFYTWDKFNAVDESFEVCIIKQVTDIPCPSCGSTRSVLSLFKGQVLDALKVNPIGLIIAGVMVLAPFWMLIDFLYRQKTMLAVYLKIEYYLKKPQFAIPLIVLVLLNWIWNITKGL